MDVGKVFHMKGGLGDTSYYNNSSKMKDITLEAMRETYRALRPESVGIADLGCSSGFNTLRYIKMLVAGLEGLSRELRQPSPEFRVCLNDLPTNDFNTLFQSLPDLYEELNSSSKLGDPSIFVAAYPGNFYHRLFPNNSLHFVFSFSSLHWLSQGRIDKEKLESFDVHYYEPCKQEIQDVVSNQGSFKLERLQIERDVISSDCGLAIAKTVRAVQESMISLHFGEGILDELFAGYWSCTWLQPRSRSITLFPFLENCNLWLFQ